MTAPILPNAGRAGPLATVLHADDTVPAYRFGTHRAVGPAATLRRISPLLPLAGITRLADVTGLDWLGVPVYQAIRPNSRNVSVSMGKGLTRLQAKVSALMESLESFHAESPPPAERREPIASIRDELAFDPYALPMASVVTDRVPREPDYDPYAPPAGRPALLHDHVPLDWTVATDLATGTITWVPSQLCTLDLTLRERLAPPLFRATSNGLASGNTVAEALVHGLCEVIERDGMWRAGHGQIRAERCVSPHTVNAPLCRRLIDRLGERGIELRITDATGPTGFACFQVFLGCAGSAVHHGAGCHPRRATALLRALTEAVQSRAGHIAGSRDDLLRRSYPSPGVLPELPTAGGPAYSDVPDEPVTGWASLVRLMVNRVRMVTGQSPVAVDLRRPEFDLPVVHVVAPGLELQAPRRR